MSSFYYPSLLKEVYFNRFKCLQRIALNNIIQNNILIHPLTLSCSHLPNWQNESELNTNADIIFIDMSAMVMTLVWLSRLLRVFLLFQNCYLPGGLDCHLWIRKSWAQILLSFFHIMFVFYGFLCVCSKRQLKKWNLNINLK